MGKSYKKKEGNVYYDPQKFGLRILCNLDGECDEYEYNTFLVFVHEESERVYWAQDSGCSCPTPFEDCFFNSPDDTNMDEVTHGSWDSFYIAIKSFPASDHGWMDVVFMLKKAMDGHGSVSKCLEPKETKPFAMGKKPPSRVGHQPVPKKEEKPSESFHVDLPLDIHDVLGDMGEL